MRVFVASLIRVLDLIRPTGCAAKHLTDAVEVWYSLGVRGSRSGVAPTRTDSVPTRRLIQ